MQKIDENRILQNFSNSTNNAGFCDFRGFRGIKNKLLVGASLLNCLRCIYVLFSFCVKEYNGKFLSTYCFHLLLQYFYNSIIERYLLYCLLQLPLSLLRTAVNHPMVSATLSLNVQPLVVLRRQPIIGLAYRPMANARLSPNAVPRTDLEGHTISGVNNL